MGRLDGKVAVVTGAGKGIGCGIARRFAREGAKVVVAELDSDAGKQVVGDLVELGGQGLFVQTDVSRKTDIEGAIAAAQESFGGLDILVNNAIALTPDVPLEYKTDEMLEQTMKVGLWSVWWGMQTAFPLLKDRGGGRIINFYSIDADDGHWVHADYNTAKGGVQALTRTAGFQWARHNICVNAIAPIAASAAFEKMVADNPELGAAIPTMIPMGRMGDPEEDIAPVVAFLASDEARFITGATIPVDGGLHVPRVNTKPPDPSVFDSAPASGQ
ncbi:MULTISPECIES: SDR family NAD(P)-dependent oxidoreductase [Mycobacterium]|jgi:NAD(P)-dependent dehydrogenase (short-subunit alcohol dehydrogenase family)|uniref:Short-chain dehydrogenase n=4 Tax=Mycobacterium TaxID=1763 RepID=A0A1X0K547_MYCSC|nr:MULTISPECIES: SDR family NAD(P)-dependent oxidoreductase [Mycobacterium]AFC42755.1 short-chain dehydrogenase/reductase SDR [Mycobacterium intracellulare ATCC 13950]AFC47854.1 short-chain dehydrogenase/reductase SDR [Mycobacterium intracellulare MOTT-02]ASW94619.1 NAD(P)-dependent oxidoreductase [Mycobacterium intracellulare]ETZ38027.1 short chain dehydrogenase family protein [Mycobacterium intracellulare MIN_061107_1834]KLO45846.1 short-chain dehydrogenase [Mycobacterium nebraskense]